jgi:ABC-type oligopeptide transport system substrate-binding subunit/transcriptional regulator with XRE-family HTH domain
MSRSPAGAAALVTLRGTQGVQMGGPAVSFGTWVRRRRLTLDLTRDALARRVGCSVSAVKKIERDERRPSRTMATRFADALGIPPDQRDRFIDAGLGELAADRLPEGSTTAGVAPPWLSRPRDVVRRPVVGRTHELDRLHAHLDAALSGHGRTVFVTGEAGQGKTALLTAFADRAQEAVPNLVVARGAGTALGSYSDPDLLIRDVFGMLLADPLAPVQADLLTPAQAQRLWEFAPAVARTIDQVGPHLLGTVVPTGTLWERLGMGVALEAAGPTSRDNLIGDVTSVLQVLARTHPLLILFDDMQWADAASADLVFHLARRLTDSRVLVVCAFRNSEVTGNLRPASALVRKTLLEVSGQLDDPHIDLEQTDSDAARELCSALLDLEAPGLGPAVHDQFYARTQGHPLFVRELVRDLIARGDLAQRPDTSWDVSADLDWDRVPARVAAVIEQRLDRLGPDERALLDAAAVEGEHFVAEIAAAATSIDEQTAQKLLADQLDRVHHLVREAGATRVADRTVTRYRFGHELFQRFVYTRLASGPRRDAHRRLAEALQDLCASDLDQIIAQLAYHYAEAGDGHRATPYLIKVGDRARMVQAHAEAVAAYSRAAEWFRELGDHAQLARTMMKLGVTYQTGFDHSAAQRAFDEAFDLWPAVNRELTGDESHAPATLRLLSPEPVTLDPVAGGDVAAVPLANTLFSGLVRYDEDSNVVPDVAERWTISADGRRYEFHLRDDVVWSDGQPVTAGDFAFTYRRALTDKPRWDPLPRDLLAAIARPAGPDGEPAIYAAGDSTLVIELSQPTSYFLYNLIHDVLMPVPRHVVIRHGDSWWRPDTIVSNGPFVLAAWDAGSSLTLDRNPRYHRVARGNVQHVEVRFTTLRSTDPVRLYSADQVDVLATTLFTPSDVINKLSRTFPADLSVRAGSRVVYYWLDPDTPAFADRRLREAMALAIDRDAHANYALKDTAIAATGGLVSPEISGHLPGIAPPPDPDRAAHLVREALDGSAPPALTITTFYPFGELGERLASEWRAIGIDARAHTTETFPELGMTPADAPAASVAVAAWIADYPDPDTVLRIGVTSLLPRWRHPQYHALIDAATRATDPAERLAKYQQAERVLAQEYIVVPLVYVSDRFMIKPWVLRYPTVPFFYNGFWQDVVIDPTLQR